MRKVILIILILALAVGLYACNRKDTEPAGAENNKYTLEIDVADDLKSATLRESISYTNATGTELKEIKLRVYPEAYGKDSVACAYFTKLQRYGGIEVARVAADGADIAFTVEGTVLTCTLATSLGAGGKITLYIESSLTVPESNLRLGLAGGVLSLSNFYPVLCVYGNGAWRTDAFCKIGDPFVQDCADYDVTLTCPSALVVAASGSIVSQNEADGSRKCYKIEGKSLRDFSVQASATFKTAEALAGNTTIRYYYVDDARREKELNAARSALESFEQVFGEYPYKVFSLVERDFYYNGDGYGNLAVISKTAESKESVIVKETAHQWLRGIVAADAVAAPWQNQALGAFLQGYYFYLNGDKAAYASRRDAIKKEYISFQNTRKKSDADSSFGLARPITAYLTNYEYGMITGKKGFLMLDAVFQTLGKEKMNKALKAYCDTYAYRCASAQEMMDAFDKATKQNVGGIMKAWLEDKTVIAGAIIYVPGQEA